MWRSEQLLLASVITLCLPSLSHSQEVILEDTFDSGIVGWVYEGAPTGTASHDPSIGDPDAGSLRLTSTAVTTPRTAQIARSESCYRARNGDVWRLAAKARQDLGQPIPTCTTALRFYPATDCSGEPYATEGDPSPPPGEWVAQEDELPLLGEVADLVGSLEIVFIMDTGNSPAAGCNFDSLVVTRLRAPGSIPTLSPAILAGLAGLLGLMGALALRRL